MTPSPDGKVSFNMLVYSRLLPTGTIVMYLGDNLSTMEEDVGSSTDSLIIANILILESNTKEMLVLHRGHLPMSQKDMFLAAHHNFFLFFKELG